MAVKELSYETLRTKYRGMKIESEDDEDSGMNSILEQERAVKALEFGIHVKQYGYNIYVAGPAGLGKKEYIKEYLEKCSKDLPTPDDWCYVYDFDKPSSPKPIRFKAGKGRLFKKDIDKTIKDLSEQIKNQFESIEFELQKNAVISKYKKKNEDLIKVIKKDAEKFNFATQVTDKDIFFIPIVDQEKLSEEMFDDLNEEQKELIIKKSEILQQKATEILKTVKKHQKEVENEVKILQHKIVNILVQEKFKIMSETYQNNECAMEYIEQVKEDIIKNADTLIEHEKNDDSLLALLPVAYKNTNEEIFEKYKVNVIVDNGACKGAPVIMGSNPTMHNLIGKVELENEFGSAKTDLTKIKPGLLHKANGGYIILEVEELLSNIYSWETLKLVLKTKQLIFRCIKEQLGSNLVPNIKPQPIPIETKIILIGSYQMYNILYDYDRYFSKLFKVKVMFESEVEKDESNEKKIVRYVNKFVRENELLEIDKSAYEEIMNYSSRLVMNKEKLSTSLNKIGELLIEADICARNKKEEKITSKIIKMTIAERENRLNILEERIDSMIEENQILLNLDGKCIGQINVLAVLDSRDYVFAKPSRLTATTFMGKSGIVNIEKEANMSGNIHIKGVHVLTGYLGHKYAQKFPLSLSCQLCFEQNYSMIDGDSASCAELLVILSSLAGVPLKQNIAITGSINQFGEIQPIGGVTLKVEGFFKACKKQKLTGKQGVIIPYQNQKELILKEDVLQAIKDGLFHIYPVKNVNDAIEIMTDLAAVKVHNRVYKKLMIYNKDVNIL